VAVEDLAGECDALFDETRWQWTYPDLWGHSSQAEYRGDTLTRLGLMVLEGVGCAPQVSTIGTMVPFAKSQLTAKNGQTWHAVPQFYSAI
jgi:hypothetical protein